MKMIQIMLSPTPAQVTLIERQLAEHRALYNICLDKKSRMWKEHGKNVSTYDLMKSEIPLFKATGTISNYSSFQQTIRRLDKAYAAFFCQENWLPKI